MSKAKRSAPSDKVKLKEWGLTNIDLIKLVKNLNIKNFAGVFMSDQLPKRIKKNECGIINYQDSTKEGSHWVAYFNRSNLRYACYFDPEGFPPIESAITYLKTSKKEILWSDEDFQKDDNTCGLFAIKFILQMQKGVNEVDGYYYFDIANDNNDSRVKNIIK